MAKIILKEMNTMFFP